MATSSMQNRFIAAFCSLSFVKGNPHFMLSARLSFFQHPPMDEISRDHGTQPLDALMTQWGLNNHDLVEAAGKSFAQLNHKQVQKGRKGRQLTLKMMQKLAAGLNDAIFLSLPKEKREPFEPYLHRHLFNYARGYDAEWADPNKELMPKKEE